MSVPLLHSPADIASRALAQLGLGTDPDATDVWPVFAAKEPPAPDACITVYDTAPQYDGRDIGSGEVFHHFGLQVRIRASDHPTGYVKLEAVHTKLTEGAVDIPVSIDGATYLLHCFAKSRFGFSGQETPTSRRYVFTVNTVVSLRRLN